MMSKKSPQLRFEGFTDDWEDRELGEEFKKVSERNDGSFGRDHWISVAKMYFQSPEKVQSNNIDTRTYVMREGDIAFEGHPNSEFKFGRFVANDIGAGVVSELFPIYKHQHEYDNNYWKNAIQIERIMAPIFAKSITSSGNSSNKLDTKHFLRQKILIPQINEQKKMGSFFKQLDNTIALHQRKLDLLKEQKKGYLQKMFPKNGAKVPELRFSGFADDWEERKLGDISKVIDPHPSHRAPAATEEGIPFIGIGDVNEVGKINYKTARIVDAKIFDEHHNRYDLSIPSIGIGRVASLGKVIRLRDDIGKYVVSPTMSVIQFTNNNDLDFLYSNMNTPIFQKQFKSFSNGSTRQSVGIQDLRILMVSLPVDIDEQQKIGSFFKKIDDTIALHQRKLDLLKEQKKGFLQKMFV
ncbi:restriction endonuclease subunit S [Streptococcus parauberis]|uniref:restriction endonuclease subunit S n=1 Tax=Streptococcus parauberis TaxID=1348 RepID=UPI000562D4CC|nr:restriction endonuclease subunit S [Streptococcus parauberis]UWM87808.1 restriction endonuclease subunit S [Streptococcus parauberis]UWM89780.1 restriction endonuclease subunit S [Streptococcus parauberis]